MAEGQPGEELQLDFGAVGWIGEAGRRRRMWALALTAVVSRHQYVWLTYRQSVADVVAGCEAAWAFFGGVFRVFIPDNLKAIATAADRDAPRLNPAFLEDAQARRFVVDTARCVIRRTKACRETARGAGSLPGRTAKSSQPSGTVPGRTGKSS